MAIPSRNADPQNVTAEQRTFFVETNTAGRRRLLQSERSARLLIDVLFHYRNRGDYRVHAFVVMPNHFHGLLTLPAGVTIEHAMQLIKGGYSFRARREIAPWPEVWQRGFSEKRVRSRDELLSYRNYIHMNPVKAGLAATPEEFPYSSAHPSFRAIPAKTAAAEAGQF